MIGRLKGRIDLKGEGTVLLDVRGVGYVVHCSDRTMASLPPVGEAVALWTELVVREDLMQLFGFETLLEKEWHRLLTSITGVGAKASMAILGTLGADGVSRAIALGDWGAVRAAPGVGPKIAQRVVNELKDRAGAVMAMGGMEAAAPQAMRAAAMDVEDDAVIDAAPVPPPAATGGGAAQAEALSALSNLGYSPSEAASAVAKAAGASPGAGTADLIRASLRLLAPKD